MKKHFIKTLLIILPGVFCFHLIASAQNNSSAIDLNKERIITDSLDKLGAKYFLEGDSVAMYKMYAKDADLGGMKGKDILSFWGSQIRNSIKTDTRNMEFASTSLSTDGEFLVETGTITIKDSKGNFKGKGKYVVVWKREDGTWKLYRDDPL